MLHDVVRLWIDAGKAAWPILLRFGGFLLRRYLPLVVGSVYAAHHYHWF